MGCCKSNTTSNSGDEMTATSNPSDEAIALSMKEKSSHAEIREYWTTDRMQNAIPYPKPMVTEDADDMDQDEEDEVIIDDKESLDCDSCLPQEHNESDHKTDAADLKNGQMCLVPNTSKYPYCWFGQIHFKQGEHHYKGSAIALTKIDGKLNLLLTAAHCLYDRETHTYSSHIHFTATNGEHYTSQKVAIPSAYKTGSKYHRYDYGMIRVQDHSAIGGVGFAIGHNVTSPSTNKTIFACGYRDGHHKEMYQVQGTNHGLYDTKRFYMDSNFSHGASGGPWLNNIQSNWKDYRLIGLNSSHPKDNENLEISPVFTVSQWQSLIKDVNS